LASCAATSASSASPVTAAPTVTAAPKKARMILVTSPIAGAKVYDGDTLVGDEPQNIELEEGKTKSLVLKATGYKDATVALDGKSPAKITVQMTKIPGANLPSPVPTKKTGGSEADDPWAKK
jgi:uncharacterized cupredoxin-like copper-binding protein